MIHLLPFGTSRNKWTRWNEIIYCAFGWQLRGLTFVKLCNQHCQTFPSCLVLKGNVISSYTKSCFFAKHTIRRFCFQSVWWKLVAWPNHGDVPWVRETNFTNMKRERRNSFFIRIYPMGNYIWCSISRFVQAYTNIYFRFSRTAYYSLVSHILIVVSYIFWTLYVSATNPTYSSGSVEEIRKFADNYYSDVTWPSWRLKSPVTPLFG